MDDRNKTTMTTDDDFPIVSAIVVESGIEAFSETRAEFVIIDEFFDHNSNTPDLLSESNIAASSEQNFDPMDSNRNHARPQEDYIEDNFAPNNVRYSKMDSSKTFGAWAAGIVLGFVVGAGTSLSMAFGFGAAYYSSQEGVAGDVARAIGDVALVSHAKFVQVNEKHKLIDTVANGAVAFSKNCLVFTKRYIYSLFTFANQNNDTPTRQTSTLKKETT